MRTRMVVLVLVIAFAVVPVGAYVTHKTLSNTGAPVQSRWAAFPIQWRMNPTRGPNIQGSIEQADALRTGFAAWSSINTAAISFTEGAVTAPTTIPTRAEPIQPAVCARNR